MDQLDEAATINVPRRWRLRFVLFLVSTGYGKTACA